MGPSITAIALALIAQGLAFCVILYARLGGTRAFFVWTLSLFPLFLLSNGFLTLAIAGVAMLALAPIKASHRIAFYILVVPAVPFYVQFDVPFPGINYLMSLNHQRIAAVVILLPLLFYPGEKRAKWGFFDFALIAYAIYSAVMVALSVNVTGGLRYLMEQLLLLVIPYLAIVRSLHTTDDLEDTLRAYLSCSVILAAIAFIATLKQWDFYSLPNSGTAFAVADYRGGYLRIAGVANTHSLGFHLAAALLLVEHLKTRMNWSFITSVALRGLLLIGVLATSSRGALAGLVIGYGVYFVFMLRSAFVWFLAVLLAIVATTIGGYWLLQADHSAFDPYGTFNYRQELVTTSLAYMREHLLFGDLHFLASGRFDHLVQGQGIVDVTNLYLQIGLVFGLIGLGLFFTIYAGTVVLLALSARFAAANPIYATLNPAILACLIGWLVLVATTSDVALTIHLGILFAAFGRCALTIAHRQHQLATAHHADAVAPTGLART